jgi:hypothetical protein
VACHPAIFLLLQRINSTPEQFPIHQPMYFRVCAFCEQEERLAVP